MGQEIDSTRFSEQQWQQFQKRLSEETQLLRRQLEAGDFSAVAHVSGCELEAWLVDRDCQAAPLNDQFLGHFADPTSSAELGRFNVEFTTPPTSLRGSVFRDLEAALDAIMRKARSTAQSLGLDVVLIGTLPTLRDAQLNLSNLSELNRYRALNEQIVAARGGTPIRLDITGRQHLCTTHRDVMLEAAATSFQVHWQLAAAHTARYYNAALVASAPVLAISVNSPFLFQKDLWAETRIPLFEQAIPLSNAAAGNEAPFARVSFGSGWVRDSVAEVFQENQDAFPVLLPIQFNEDAARFAHLRLHNGTIWRWNRPLVGFDPDGRAHIRLEHRALPAGPTIVDMVANAVFFYGLVQSLVDAPPPQGSPSFSDVKANFYAAARHGLVASFRWFGGRSASALEVVRRSITAARDGLTALGVDRDDIERYLAIIEHRLASGQNGCEWQRRFMGQYPGEFAVMTREYFNHQTSGRPVHEWGL